MPGTDDRLHYEPVDRWLEFVEAAAATLRLAVAAYDKHAGKPEDWTSVIECLLPDASADLRQFLASMTSQPHRRMESRQMVVFLVYQWLELGDVRPAVNWDSDNPQILLSSSHSPPPLFGVLAAQLALTVARANELAHCSGCSTLYSRKRKPQRNRRNYCNTCQKNGVPARDAQRARRAREIEKKKALERAAAAQPENAIVEAG